MPPPSIALPLVALPLIALPLIALPWGGHACPVIRPFEFLSDE
jgi:hypothetical protein